MIFFPRTLEDDYEFSRMQYCWFFCKLTISSNSKIVAAATEMSKKFGKKVTIELLHKKRAVMFPLANKTVDMPHKKRAHPAKKANDWNRAALVTASTLVFKKQEAGDDIKLQQRREREREREELHRDTLSPSSPCLDRMFVLIYIAIVRIVTG